MQAECRSVKNQEDQFRSGPLVDVNSFQVIGRAGGVGDQRVEILLADNVPRAQTSGSSLSGNGETRPCSRNRRSAPPARFVRSAAKSTAGQGRLKPKAAIFRMLGRRVGDRFGCRGAHDCDRRFMTPGAAEECLEGRSRVSLTSRGQRSNPAPRILETAMLPKDNSPFADPASTAVPPRSLT